MGGPRLLFDEKCFELAQHFNGGDRDLTELQLNELAQHIQDAVEDYFLGLDIEAAAAVARVHIGEQA